jgi:arginyl-tRNA synthetase
MKDVLVSLLTQHMPIDEKLLKPTDSVHGDFTYPCFVLAKELKKAPQQIAIESAAKLSALNIPLLEKVEAVNGYLNFFIQKGALVAQILQSISLQPYADNGKSVVIDLSAPNIAKSLGIGHLRSTVIGNSLALIHRELGYSVTTINYLGDWGTQFGKLIYAYRKYRDDDRLSREPITYLQEIYVKINQDIKSDTDASGNSPIENECRDIFAQLENGDAQLLELWQKFRELSLVEFYEAYNLLGVSFDVISGESFFRESAKTVVADLVSRGIATKSDGATVVDLSDDAHGKLGVVILQKQDGSTIYVSRDIAAAIDRYAEFKFSKMIYEVGAEQQLHFKQLFTILDLMGNSWAKDCVHVSHGLYLGEDGKKLSTRKGTSLKMMEIWRDIEARVVHELKLRDVSEAEIESRKVIITRAALIYADLFNYREKSVIINIDKLAQIEGETGPYLLYSYARSRSILRKLGFTDSTSLPSVIPTPTFEEVELVKHMGTYSSVLSSACEKNDPSQIANFAQKLSRLFNTFYSANKVAGSDEQAWRVYLVFMYGEMLKKSLDLLGISVLEEM